MTWLDELRRGDRVVVCCDGIRQERTITQENLRYVFVGRFGTLSFMAFRRDSGYPEGVRGPKTPYLEPLEGALESMAELRKRQSQVKRQMERFPIGRLNTEHCAQLLAFLQDLEAEILPHPLTKEA